MQDCVHLQNSFNSPLKMGAFYVKYTSIKLQNNNNNEKEEQGGKISAF